MKQQTIDKVFKEFDKKYKKIVIIEGKYKTTTSSSEGSNIVINSICGYGFVDQDGNKYTREQFEPIAIYENNKFFIGNNKCWAGIL